MLNTNPDALSREVLQIQIRNSGKIVGIAGEQHGFENGGSDSDGDVGGSTTRRAEKPKDLGGLRRQLLGEWNDALLKEKRAPHRELLGSARAP